VNYPTIAEVIAADQEQVSLWWHSLSDPKTPFEGTRDGLVFKKDCVTGGFEPQQQLVWTTGRVQCWNHCKPPSRCAISDQLFDTAV